MNEPQSVATTDVDGAGLVGVPTASPERPRRERGPDAEFLPPPWLRNPHIQSIYPSLAIHRPRVARYAREIAAASRREVLDCGDGVRLLAYTAPRRAAARPAAGARVAVLLHGWEGSSNSLYLLSLGQFLHASGYEVVRLNLRDHGDSHDLNEELFHSNRIEEVTGAVREIQRLHPGELHLIGFSLGGNFCLRVAARAPAAGIEIASVVAVCPVIDPAHTLATLESGWALYRRYFVQKWRRSLLRKHAAWPGRYDFGDMLRTPSLTEMTEHLVRRFTDYGSLDAYLQGYALTGDALRKLAVRSRVIVAADDPIIPVADLERLPSAATLSVTRTAFGGHCGYYDGRPEPGWLAREVLRTHGAGT
jgi:predicted alpha/beta-fold hydrolase